MPTEKVQLIKAIYLYLVAIITLVMMIVSLSTVINTTLKEFVFKVPSYEEIEGFEFRCENGGTGIKIRAVVPVPVELDAEKEELTEEEMQKCLEEEAEKDVLRRKQRIYNDLIRALSLLIIAFPIYMIHWRIIKKEFHK